MQRMPGFSFLQLGLVIAVIGTAASAAIPKLLHSQVAANESSAVGTILAVNRAEAAYMTRNSDRGFTCNLQYLASAEPGLVDRAMARGVKSGYRVAASGCTGVPSTSYFVVATPLRGEGVRSFCSDASGIIRYGSHSGQCTTASPPLE